MKKLKKIAVWLFLMLYLIIIMGFVNGFLRLLRGDFSGAWESIVRGVENFAGMLLSAFGTKMAATLTIRQPGQF